MPHKTTYNQSVTGYSFLKNTKKHWHATAHSVRCHGSYGCRVAAGPAHQRLSRTARPARAGKAGGSAAQSGGGQYDSGRCAEFPLHLFLKCEDLRSGVTP